MTTRAERERQLITHAETTQGLMNHIPIRFYRGFTWAYQDPPVLTRQFVEYLISVYAQKLGHPAQELLIRYEDVKPWMDALDIQIIPGVVPPKCFYLGVAGENRSDAIESPEATC